MNLLKDLRRIPTLLKREWDYAQRRLKGCSLEPTYRCNLRCKMCGTYALAKPGDKERELTREEMLKIVDDLGEMGATWLQLIGGEPFLRADDMLAVTARANQVGVEATIITNGALVKEDLAREILDVRTPRLVFSVDGVGEAHDRVRAVPGAFDRTQNGMRLIIAERRRRGLKTPVVEIQSTISRLNFDQVNALVRFKEEIGADALVFNYLSEIPEKRLEATRLNGEPLCSRRWAPTTDSLLLTAAEIAPFRQALERAPADKQIRLMKALGDGAYTKCLYPTRRCYFMRNVMIINPFGEAYPCPHIDAYITGNVRDAGVRAVWQNERHRQVISRLRKGMYPVCSSCCVFSLNLTPIQAVRLGMGMKL